MRAFLFALILVGSVGRLFAGEISPPVVAVCDGVAGYGATGNVRPALCSVSWRFVAADSVTAGDALMSCGYRAYLQTSGSVLVGGVPYHYANCNDQSSGANAWGWVLNVASSQGGVAVLGCRDSGYGEVNLVLNGVTFKELYCGAASPTVNGLVWVNLAYFAPGLFGLSSGGGGSVSVPVRRSNGFSWMLMQDVLGKP